MTIMKTVKENNYYIRDDGIINLIIVADINNIGLGVQVKIIMPSRKYYIYGEIYCDLFENFNEYKLIDYKEGKRFDKLMSL